MCKLLEGKHTELEGGCPELVPWVPEDLAGALTCPFWQPLARALCQELFSGLLLYSSIRPLPGNNSCRPHFMNVVPGAQED